MKKYLFGFMLAFGVLFASPINAASHESIEISDLKLNYQYIFKNNKFRQIKDYSNTELVRENKANGITVFYQEYKNSDNSIIRSGEWFKKINGKNVNFKETLEEGYRTKNQFSVHTRLEIEFYVDNSKCKTGAEFINNNCQSKSYKNIKNERIQGNRVKERVSFTYLNSTNPKKEAYLTLRYDIASRDKLEKIFDISSKRKSNNVLQSVRIKFYEENKLVNLVDSMKIDYNADVYDINNAKSYGIKSYEYDNRGRIINSNKTHYVNDKEVVTYNRDIQYHSNGKIYLQNIQKKSFNNKLYYNQTNKYNKKGKRRGNIRYSYKNGIVTLRREYVYNNKSTLKGKAYRFTTTYKKGKRVKTYRQAYNKKGKLQKKKYVKHRTDYKVYKEEDDFYF